MKLSESCCAAHIIIFQQCLTLVILLYFLPSVFKRGSYKASTVDEWTHDSAIHYVDVAQLQDLSSVQIWRWNLWTSLEEQCVLQASFLIISKLEKRHMGINGYTFLFPRDTLKLILWLHGLGCWSWGNFLTGLKSRNHNRDGYDCCECNFTLSYSLAGATRGRPSWNCWSIKLEQQIKEHIVFASHYTVMLLSIWTMTPFL